VPSHLEGSLHAGLELADLRAARAWMRFIAASLSPLEAHHHDRLVFDGRRESEPIRVFDRAHRRS